jgi:dipeptidyl aminopeptidase/acylaminoacyl peptidase
VWVMPLQTPGEPRRVTNLEHGAGSPRWRRDGKALLVNSAIPTSQLPSRPDFDLERPGRNWFDFDRPVPNAESKGQGSPDGDLRSIRNWLEHNSARNDPSDLTRINFLGELSLNGELTINELFRVDLGAEPKTTQLTSTFRGHNEAIFSPKGDRILFASTPRSNLHPDRLREKTVIWEAAADGTGEHPLIAQEEYSFRMPQFTPDGKHLILLGAKNDQPTYRQTALAMCDNDGANLKWLTPDGEPSIEAADVSEEDRVYYNTEFHGGQPLHRVHLQTGAIEDVVDGPVGVNAFAVAAGKILYAQISAENPNELYVLAARGQEKPEQSSARRLTEINARWLEDKVVSLPEEHWITRPDGLKVQYWVMKPANAQPGKQYPWVLDIHGGLSAMWGPGEFTMWHEFQILCSFGYGVVYSNPRGSAGYGYAFQRANFKDWGNGPMGDVMGVVDDAVARYSIIDPNQLFVTGGSYAGYLTAWIIGHTDRFKAAAALRGVYDLSTFFGEGNAYRLVPEEFGGYPWEPGTRKLLDEQSPVTYVSKMNTPLLIIHGSSDNRTGVVQGQMLFRALKQMNKPVEYVRYPGAGHEITRSGEPRQRMDHMLRIIEFFERYTKNAAPAPQVEAGAVTSAGVP